jgi:hypothetical protein
MVNGARKKASHLILGLLKCLKSKRESLELGKGAEAI